MDLRREEIVPLLSKGYDASDSDRKNFNEWAMGMHTTSQSIKKFRLANGITQNIDEDEYVKWLNSLGYRRVYDSNAY